MFDQKVFNLIKKEGDRQKTTIPLIASENFCSDEVRGALSSVFVNKYAEGQPGARYYAGNQVADELETLAVTRALKLFVPAKIRKNWHANVQPLSGSPANLAVYAALLKPGDKILAMSLSAGGHLSHGHPITLPGKLYQIEQYGVDPKTEQLDYAAILTQAKKVKPQLIIAGASAYPRVIDFTQFAKIAQAVGAYLLADVSHVAGLIAAGLHPSPIPYADVVTTTTHKTLRGPRAALILCRQTLADQIDRGVFPQVQGGPHLNQIAAVAVALYEAGQPTFKTYTKKVIQNAQILATELSAGGLRIVSGGTDNHLVLAEVTPLGLTGKEAQERLEKAGIIVNANQIPFDQRPPRDPSGIRLGTAAITTRGASKIVMETVGSLVVEVLQRKSSLKSARYLVHTLNKVLR